MLRRFRLKLKYLLPVFALILVGCEQEPDMSNKGLCILTGGQRLTGYDGYIEYQKKCENGAKIWVTHKYTSTVNKEYYKSHNIKINWQEVETD